VSNNDFYIGWMPAAPASFVKHTRKVLVALFLLVIAVGAIVASSQKQFSTAVFEYGQLTEVKGIYLQTPVPSIKVITQKDLFGHSTYLTMPLVGYGKFGAEGIISEIEKEKQLSLDKKQVVVKGTLLYSDGKTLLQVDKHDDPFISISNTIAPAAIQSIETDLGHIKLRGEILDPKCYFGVMKPGHGKPHRDCAIRCLLGGMSPVFYTRNERGAATYYLVLGPNGEKINEQLKDFVADPVELQANAKQFDDWVVLYVEPVSIKRISGFSLVKNTADDVFASCGK